MRHAASCASEPTSVGVRAAVSIAQALRAQIPDGAEVEVLSSDLQCAVRTAEEVAELFGVKPILCRIVLEKPYGKAGGKPQECLDWRFVPSPVVGSRMDHDEGVEGSETKAAWAQRICVATDEQFAGLFPARGKRAWSPGWQALLVLHFVENLTDRQAAEAVRARIDWKYALGLD